MIRIVTMEREYGCGGGEIARQLAERLGWKLWDELLTEEIARLADCPKNVVAGREERNDPLHPGRQLHDPAHLIAQLTAAWCARPGATRDRGHHCNHEDRS